jgi:folate-dependent phosphoribosylglycinamide formyltransferase PurN
METFMASKKIKVVILTPLNAIKGKIVVDFIMDFQVHSDEIFEFIIWTYSDTVETHKFGKKIEVRAVNSKRLDDTEDIERLKDIDVLVSCGWGDLIASEAIATPRVAALNCHSSFLPDYKGGSVYQYQWANCERYGGATIHYMTERFDAGNIVSQQRYRIKSFDNPVDILYRASEFTGPLLVQALFLVLNGAKGSPQSGGRYFKKTPRLRLWLHRAYNMSIGSLTGKRWFSPISKKNKIHE